MDFAKGILQKYGWKEGQGLGKNADGIALPIKSSLKFGKSGIGVDRAKELTDNWWERVYNDASQNLEVHSSGDNGSVSVHQLHADAVEISTKSYSVKKLQEANSGNPDTKKYGNVFLKSSTLLGNVVHEEPSSINMDNFELKAVKALTDEELLAACGGRTAHKGARHGLNLNGKLARIDEQNQKLIQKMENESFEAVIKSNEWQVHKTPNNRKKTKKQKRNEQRWLETSGANMEDDEVKDMVHHADYVVSKNRKKKQARQQMEQELAQKVSTLFVCLPEEDGLQDEAQVKPSPKKRTKSKTKKKSLEEEVDLLSEKVRKLDHNSVSIKKNKKMKMKKAIDMADNMRELENPAAKYMKGFRPDLKENNRMLKQCVPHEVPEEKPSKPAGLLHSDSSVTSEEEDVADRINKEQQRYWEKMRATVPKINIIEPTEDDCLALGQGLKERHKNEVKRVGQRTSGGKKKKSKKKARQIAKLTDILSKQL